MRLYKDTFGKIHDLDDERTYEYLPQNVKEARSNIHQEIGYYYCYVKYWHYPWDEKQEKRVESLIKRYTENWRENMNNLKWHHEILYLIQDEIENMC